VWVPARGGEVAAEWVLPPPPPPAAAAAAAAGGQRRKQRWRRELQFSSLESALGFSAQWLPNDPDGSVVCDLLAAEGGGEVERTVWTETPGGAQGGVYKLWSHCVTQEVTLVVSGKAAVEAAQPRGGGRVRVVWRNDNWVSSVRLWHSWMSDA
jgi:hypothetical protein